MATRLFWQLFPSYLLATVGVLALVALQAGPAIRAFHMDQVDSALKAQANIFAERVGNRLQKEQGGSESVDTLANIDKVAKKLGKETGSRLTIIEPSGKVLADSQEDPERMDNHASRPEIMTALTKKVVGRETRYSTTMGQDFRYVAVPILFDGRVIGIVRASMPVTTIQKARKALQQRILLGAIAAAFLITILSWYLARRISRPLELMTDGAARFAQGELDHRLPVKGCQEIESLAGALNAMATQLNERIETITQQRNRHQAILTSMTEGVMALDTSSKIIMLNEAGSKFLQLDPVKSRGRPIYEVLRQPAFLKFAEETLEKSEIQEEDLVIRNRTDRLFNARSTELRDAQGNKIGGLIVFQDVTQLRRLETVRQDFVANVSHELRTPITSIKGYVETLRDGALDDKQNAGRFLDIIVKQADRLNAVIEDILSLSRIEEQSHHHGVVLAPGAICEILESVVQLSRRNATEKEINITLDCEPALQAKINGTLLEQAVLNLVNNAINYSPPKSEIHITGSSDGENVLINVEDHGCGIETKHLSRLFERFYRVDKARSYDLGGTGLGLAIVKHIALAHGGSVSVKSRVGVGSTFSIRIPIDYVHSQRNL